MTGRSLNRSRRHFMAGLPLAAPAAAQAFRTPEYQRLRDELAEAGWFNVWDYGARSDADGRQGVSPEANTRAIQSAIDSVPPGQGGVVYFPTGRYRINDTLRLTRGCYLVGAGIRHSRIYQIDDTKDVVTFFPEIPRTATCFISNLTISQQNKGGPASAFRTDKVDLVFCDRVQFRNGFRGCWIEDGAVVFLHGCLANQQTGAGFYLRLGQQTLISHCHAIEQIAEGIGFQLDACRGTSLANCLASATQGGPGFYILNEFNSVDRTCTLVGCIASGNGIASPANGYDIAATSNVALNGCVSVGNSLNGIQVSGGSEWITLNGCQILNNGNSGRGSGILIQDSNDIVITGCAVTDIQAKPTQYNGIEERGNSHRTLVSGNIVRGNVNNQILLSGQSSIEVNNILG